MILLYRRGLTPLLMLGLSGCKLIDQTTFAPSPSRNPALVPQAPPAASPAVHTRVDARTPLVTIDQGTPVQGYSGVLHSAVQAARARDPNVQFDITIVVPTSGNPAASVAAAQPDVAAVMQGIVDAGVAESSVHLRAATDGRLARRQIRVYVR